jgi:hypothetical protein
VWLLLPRHEHTHTRPLGLKLKVAKLGIQEMVCHCLYSEVAFATFTYSSIFCCVKQIPNLGAKTPENAWTVNSKNMKVRYKQLGLTINLPLSLVLSDLLQTNSPPHLLELGLAQ